MAIKTGPLTKDEIAQIWQSAMDRGYWQPLADGGLGGGYEVWDQAFDQATVNSQEIDTVTQGLYINPHSSQTDQPASGAVQATVTLTLQRLNSANLNYSLTLAAGQFFDERQIDMSPAGGISVLTGRRYFIPEITLGAGETSRTVTAYAERPGFGGNNPMPGSITQVEQTGQNRSSDSASIVSDGTRYWLEVANVVDTVIPQNIGSYVSLSWSGGSARAWIFAYRGPDLTVPDGGRVALIEPYTLEFQTLSGTFVDGEQVLQGTAGGTVKRFFNPGTGRYYLTIFPNSISDVFNLSADIVGSSSGAVATTTALAVYVESPQLSVMSGGVTWTIQDFVNDYGLASTNAAQPTGGRPPQLDQLGKNFKLQRGPNEDDTLYRARLATVPDVVSPNAIRRAANRFLTAAGFDGCILREPGRSTFPTFYADHDACDYDLTARSYADEWKLLLSYEEFRAFFLLSLPPMHDGEFGIPYDATTVSAGANAYDATGYLAFYDGFAYVAAQRRRAIWQAINQSRAAGVAFELYERPASVSPPHP